ncbi:MAG: hypothetical protein A2831_03520 [Candidatus Yanofskybacteria bacterium RIFCSPHIGHO2_01_FULL_44_17]|uniref:Baseplate protein J-like domain-containing protein n=1 Tax=Candidatus Yanofskybacteria bacterium RIFCSPHIGHO2_01_FULL_44_17 TaxID=1802668 RepID=A0A1F8EZX8_9BACT|nr:MAG: hypothetical protein A2831_03520 [Candidatus Yanofskybacteria bacterium RIFCSPHIGHO2_01_FULL_44_17]
MGSTKIIHVLKSDGFDEVFDLFKNTDASEVIFVFPKGSKFAKQEKYFTAIKREADSSSKRVSIMTADPVIIGFAAQNDLELLEAPENKKRQSESPEQITKVIASELIGISEEGNEERAMLTATKKPGQLRVIKDIFRPETEHQIKIKDSKIKPFSIELRREPEQGHDVADDITQVWASQKSSDAKGLNGNRNILKTRSGGITKRAPMFFVAGASMVLILILYATLGSAQIIITPQKKELSFQIKASALSSVTEINFDFNRIPGQRFGFKDEVSGTFTASGTKEVVQKARGRITIYNKSSSSQRLVATTRFKSPSGLIYRIPETIELPPATGVGVNLKEGSRESVIYADKAGAEYNIDPATFTIPGFEGSSKFDEFYAKSNEPMSGGIIGPSKVITEEDLTKAQEELRIKLKENILRSLKDQAGDLKILDSTEIKFDAPVTNAGVGEAAEALEIKIKGTASTMAFRETDILELVKKYVTENGDSELLEKNLTIAYLNPQNNSDGSAMSFDIKVTGQSAAKINQEKILKDVPGMNSDAIREYFKNIKEIKSTRVKFSPIWVNSVPRNVSKIKLIIDNE